MRGGKDAEGVKLGVSGQRPFSKAPSGRELPTKSGEGECASKRLISL